MSASSEGARVAHSAYRRPSICLLSARLSTSVPRLIWGSLGLLAGSPERRHGVRGHDGHLDPALLVIRGPSVGGGQVVIRCNHAADLAQWFDAELAREHFVLADVCMNTAELAVSHTARPHISRASRPARVMRAAVQGGSQTTLTTTSATPGSRRRRSRTSSMMKSAAGQPIAVKVRSTVTRASRRRTP